MRTTLMSLALLALLNACKDLPTDTVVPPEPVTASAAGPVGISRGEETFTYTSYTVDCSGELTAITATQRYRYQVVQHPSGDWMLSQHQETDIRGAGTVTGHRYIGSGVFNTVQVFAAPENGAFQYVTSYHEIGITQGPADNSWFVVRAKWTIDATGKVAVEQFSVEWECRG